MGFLLLKLPELYQLSVVFSTTIKLFLAGLDVFLFRRKVTVVFHNKATATERNWVDIEVCSTVMLL